MHEPQRLESAQQRVEMIDELARDFAVPCAERLRYLEQARRLPQRFAEQKCRGLVDEVGLP